MSMDFFARQAQVRRSSRTLVVLFVLGVAAVMAAVDVVVVLAVGLRTPPAAYPGAPVTPTLTIDWSLVIGVSIAVLVLITLASAYRLASLRGGGANVARNLGATPVPADTTNPVWRRLRDVIEEIAIASGAPVPDIFVLEQESGINAFAAGYSASDAAVCVTQGCLDRLTRDELQGVIAHEFSHVLNGDMRLNIRLMGLLFGILVIGIIGRFMLFSGGRVRSRNGNGTASIALIGIAVVIVGYIGFFFGRLIQAAVSRSRESLADASAVQFTRQSRGIAGALKKIAALEAGSALSMHNKQEVAHMLFGEGGGLSSLFATHPPLPERIRALGEPWDEHEIEALAQAWQQPLRADDPDAASASLSGYAPQLVSGLAAGAVAAAPPVQGDTASARKADVSARVGNPNAADFALAGALKRELPPALLAMTRGPRDAQALLLALALAPDTDLRAAQCHHVEQTMGSHAAAAAEQAAGWLGDVAAIHRLPLAAMALPALRRCPHAELIALLDTLEALVRADQKVDLHEYCLVRLLAVQLRDVLAPATASVSGGRALSQCAVECASLCAIVAGHGSTDPALAQHAWRLAVTHALPDSRVRYQPPADWQGALDDALPRLDRLRAEDKRRLVDALVLAVSADGRINVAEAELLRVICAALHCPLPFIHARDTA